MNLSLIISTCHTVFISFTVPATAKTQKALSSSEYVTRSGFVTRHGRAHHHPTGVILPASLPSRRVLWLGHDVVGRIQTVCSISCQLITACLCRNLATVPEAWMGWQSLHLVPHTSTCGFDNGPCKGWTCESVPDYVRLCYYVIVMLAVDELSLA